MHDPMFRMEEHRKLKSDRKEAYDAGDLWLHLEVKGRGHQAMMWRLDSLCVAVDN